MSDHLVIMCAAQGCAAYFVGPARDVAGRTATRKGWSEATAADAIRADWHRARSWDPRSRTNERWFCPDCRPDRARGLGAPLTTSSIPADCPF